MIRLWKWSNLFIIGGVLLLVLSIVLTMYNIDTDGDVAKETGEVVSVLSDSIANRDDKATAMPKTEEEAIALQNRGGGVIYVDGYAYIGYLTVPSQSLELPILLRCTEQNLKKAPCCYSGSVYSGDLVLAGHNYRSHFGKLNNLSVGDVIRFTNVFGVVSEYKVAELQQLRPTSVEAMKHSGFDLSLFTCTLNGNARFTVRCVRTG